MKLVVLRGLPASGKTTYAFQLVNQGYKRVNRDDLRQMLDNGVYTLNSEQSIRAVRDQIIIFLLWKYNVVVDDTNLKRTDIQHFEELAKDNEAEFEVVDHFLTNVSVEECIRRDSLREKPIGEKVIKDMFLAFLNQEVGQNGS